LTIKSLLFVFLGLLYSIGGLQIITAQEITIGSRNLEIIPDRLHGCSILYKGELAQDGAVVFVEPIKEKLTLNYIDVKLKKKVADKKQIIVQLFDPKKTYLEWGTLIEFSNFYPLLAEPIEQFANTGWNRINLKHLNIQIPERGFYIVISSLSDELILERNFDNAIFLFHLYKGKVPGLSLGYVKSNFDAIFPSEVMYMDTTVNSTAAIVVNASN